MNRSIAISRSLPIKRLTGDEEKTDNSWVKISHKEYNSQSHCKRLLELRINHRDKLQWKDNSQWEDISHWEETITH